MPLLKSGDTIGLISCSDGLRPEERPLVENVIRVLTSMGLKVNMAETIYRLADTPFSGSPAHRSGELMRLFKDPSIKTIFDLSGGDSANQILPYLDYDSVCTSDAVFVGISDLSVINNAIFTRCGKISYHYRIKNLTEAFATEQKIFFLNYFMTDSIAPSFKYRWLRGHHMSGTVIGGNIRCFLKLASTRFFPDAAGKVIFLESLGGGPARMASLLAQLDQLSVFSKCSGILLGTFSTMQQKGLTPSIDQLVLEVTEKYGLPVAKTEQLGHGENAGCLPIGRQFSID